MSLVLTDLPTRRLYASDASMYEELPTGVAFPRSAGEVRALVLEARERGLPLTPRAAGTSLAGQATGSGVIVDVSRHLTRILSLDPDARLARVEPGVIRDTLNREAARYGLQFGPDTSTTNRCMIGGMIGNNSCGSFSIRHGSTRDHVVEIEAVLSDGSAVVFGPLTPEELEERCRRGTLEGAIYRGILSLLEGHRQTILEASPHPEVRRRNTGYALDLLLEMEPLTPGGPPFNLVPLPLRERGDAGPHHGSHRATGAPSPAEGAGGGPVPDAPGGDAGHGGGGGLGAVRPWSWWTTPSSRRRRGTSSSAGTASSWRVSREAILVIQFEEDDGEPAGATEGGMPTARHPGNGAPAEDLDLTPDLARSRTASGSWDSATPTRSSPTPAR
jgi:hypothetical protein